MKLKQYLPYIAVLGLFLIILSPELMTDGMFMDGLWYAAISNNLAHDIGSFWKLRFSETMYYEFYEHPPLAMGIQSLFYRLLGSSIYVERIYSLACFILNGWVMLKIWKQIQGKTAGAWLALLFWIITPLVFWSASNNILENTMMIFTSLAVLYMIKSGQDQKPWLYLFIASLFIVLAVLTKGLVGLFPLSMVLWIALFIQPRSWAFFFLEGLFMLLSIGLLFGLLFLVVPESYGSLSAYFFKQIVRSVQDIVTVESRFYIVQRLFLEMIPAIILSWIIFAIGFKQVKSHKANAWIYVLLALGFSGVLPIMVSMKQSGFYMLAALCFFPLALGIWVQPYYEVLKIRWSSKTFLAPIMQALSMLLIVTGLVFNTLRMGKVGRDEKVLADIYQLISIFEAADENIIGIAPELSRDWTLSGYFQRYAYIALDPEHTEEHRYIIVPKSSQFVPQDHQKTALELHTVDLYISSKQQ